MQKVQRTVRALYSSTFLRQNAVFFVGSVLVGFFNYLYYPVLGRLMRPGPYGEVQAVVALFLQLTILLTVLTQVTVNVVANYRDEAHKQKVVFELERAALLAALGILVLGVLCSRPLQRFFHFDSVWPFIILLLVFVASVPMVFRSAYLRAHQKFGTTSAVNIVSAATRIVFSAVFVLLGWQAAGAIGGLLAAQVVAFMYAAHEAKKLGFARPPGGRYLALPDVKVLAPELRYALFVLASTMVVTLLSSIDVFVAKHYFSPQVAGEYAGVSTVARIIYFLTSPIALVLLPAVRLHKPAAENRRLLYKSLALTLLVGAGAAGVFCVASRPVVGILMGRSYLPDAHLLPLLSAAMVGISVLNVIISYYIALRRYQITAIVLAGIGVTGALMWVHHSSLQSIVMNLIYSSLCILGLFAVWRAGRAIYTR